MYTKRCKAEGQGKLENCEVTSPFQHHRAPTTFCIQLNRLEIGWISFHGPVVEQGLVLPYKLPSNKWLDLVRVFCRTPFLFRTFYFVQDQPYVCMYVTLLRRKTKGRTQLLGRDTVHQAKGILMQSKKIHLTARTQLHLSRILNAFWSSLTTTYNLLKDARCDPADGHCDSHDGSLFSVLVLPALSGSPIFLFRRSSTVSFSLSISPPSGFRPVTAR